MANVVLPRLRQTFREQLADSLRTPLPEFTPRRVFGRVRFPGKVTAVVGMRRAGKTTFVHQLRCEHIASGVARERLPCLSFEDERFADLDVTHLDLLISEYEREFPDADGTATVIWHFDEIPGCTRMGTVRPATPGCRTHRSADHRIVRCAPVTGNRDRSPRPAHGRC